jgi:chromosome segregation ATPase
MKSNAVAILLLLGCAALAIVLLVQSKNHADEKQKQDDTIASYSNHVTSLDSQLKEQRMVNATLETNLTTVKEILAATSNSLDSVNNTLAVVSNNLDKTAADLKSVSDAKAAADAAIAEKDRKIASLENQNTELDKESADLRGEITNLASRIQTTQKKLENSEGDKRLLMDELARLRAQKEELEKKFADLAVLKAQVAKLKEELSISRRLDLIRRGLADAMAPKGGERLIHMKENFPPPSTNGLNVELHQNGEVKINSTASPEAATNAPAAK